MIYDKQKMNGKYQVGSGRIVTITQDTPFANNATTPTDTRQAEISETEINGDKVQRSSHPNDTISNEELLSDAIRLVEEGHIRPSKDESNTLASLKDTVQTLTTKKMELALLNKEWYSLNFMPKESRTPAQQNRLDEINKVRSELQKEISAGERDILDSKDKKTLVNVLKAARSENIRKGRLLKGYYENQKYHERHYKLIRKKTKVLLRS